MAEENAGVRAEIVNERREILSRLEDWMEMPMLLLSIVWLGLFVVEMIWGINPFLDVASNIIWAIFWIDFALKFTLSPDKWVYLKSNWLTVLALALPALRVFRAFRAFRLLRAARAALGAARGVLHAASRRALAAGRCERCRQDGIPQAAAR